MILYIGSRFVVLQSFLGCCVVFLLQNKKRRRKKPATNPKKGKKKTFANKKNYMGKEIKKIGLNIDSVLLWFGFLLFSYFSLYICSKVLSLITRKKKQNSTKILSNNNSQQRDNTLYRVFKFVNNSFVSHFICSCCCADKFHLK